MTIRPLLDTRYKSKDGTYPVVVRISHGKKQRDLPTGGKVQEKHWKIDQVIKHEDATFINNRIDELVFLAKQYRADCLRTGRQIRIEQIGTRNDSVSLNDLLKSRGELYREKQQHRFAAKYERIKTEIDQCFKGVVYLDEINQEWVEKYDTFLISQGNHNNTRHAKIAKLSRLFTRAVDDGKVSGPNPFKQYHIALKPTKKEKLQQQEIKQLEAADIPKGAINDARNLFLFAYYCKGARFENCVIFRRDQISRGRLEFKTNKGNKFLSVKMHSRLKAIIDQYQKTEFLFPYVREIPTDKKAYIKMIDSLNVIVNRNLKIAAGFAGIKTKVSFHISRHSFAFHLKQVTNSMHVIQESLGHSKSSTTERYVKELDDTQLDGEVGKLYGD